MDKLPPLHEQAKNLFKDLGGLLATYAKTGKVRADDNEIKRRLNICVSCDKYDSTRKRCTSCGCYTSKKVLFENIKCPLDKWSKQDG